MATAADIKPPSKLLRKLSGRTDALGGQKQQPTYAAGKANIVRSGTAAVPTQAGDGAAAEDAESPLIEVVIPDGVRAGDAFLIEFDETEYQVVAPAGCSVGDLVQIAVSGKLARLLRERADEAAAATRIAAVVRGKRARRLTVEKTADEMVVQELALVEHGASAPAGAASGRVAGEEEHERDPDLRI